MIVCGRELPIEQIEMLRAQGGQWSLRRSARELCRQLDWRGPSGKLQVSVAIKVIGQLEQKGVLPKQERVAVNLKRSSKKDSQARFCAPIPSIQMGLAQLGPVELVLVGSRWSQKYKLWRELLDGHHYLGAGPLCGHQLRYLIKSPRGWLGAIALSAAARWVAGRDRWIGWSQEARQENLYRVVSNSRFLILPQVQVPNLASHVLGQLSARVVEDWQNRHGYRPVLLESFVDLERYRGVSYGAANWQAIAVSAGRGRQDTSHGAKLSKKVLWVYPLTKDFREQLCTLPARRRLVPPPAKEPELPPPVSSWTQEEFRGCDLGDARLERRLGTLSEDFFARPAMNLPQACGSRAKTKAAYRLLDHPRVNLHSVLQSHYQATARRARAHAVILAVQDTTDLNYSTHPATELLGPICDKEGVVGMLVHDTMAYNLEATPLGLVDVQCWSRDPDQKGKRQKRYELSIEQKESSKWLVSYQAAARLQAQCPQSMVVSVGDREADLYELFVQARTQKNAPKVLVRARQERILRKEHWKDPSVALWKHVDAMAQAGRLELDLPRRQGRAKRTAILSIRFARVQLQPPKRKPGLGAVQLWAISGLEEDPPQGAQPVQWRLLTDIAIENFEQAIEKLRWYALRFQIEVYHRTLKSGCKIQDRQLGNAQRLESCLAIDMIVAWRIAHLVMLGREVPLSPCTVFFEEAQWKALNAYVTRNPQPPPEPPTLRDAVRMMAMYLGGFLGRKSDGQPGAQTIWRGLQRLDDITQMYSIFTGQRWVPPTDRELFDTS